MDGMKANQCVCVCYIECHRDAFGRRRREAEGEGGAKYNGT